MFPYYQPYQRPTAVNGRLVTNIEEARAAQIELDGSVWYFPSPSEGKIYTKSINMQGLPVFLVYEVSKTPIVDQKLDYSTNISALSKRIDNLEQCIKELKHNESTANDNEYATVQP